MQINNQDVRKCRHGEVLSLIGSVTGEVVLKVLHVPKFKLLSFEAKKFQAQEKIEEKAQDQSNDKVFFCK